MKGKNKRIFWFHSSYVLWETAKIVIKEQLKQENQRKLFEKLLFMIIRPEFKTVGCFDRFVQVFIAVSVVSVVSLVSFRCFGGSGGFVSVFRWFRRFRWFRFGVSGFSTCRLKSLPGGLGLEKCSRVFESRGFLALSSLKYLRPGDIDAFFPSPEKLLLAEKRILESEIKGIVDPESRRTPL